MATTFNFIVSENSAKNLADGGPIRNELAKRMIQLYKMDHDGDPFKTFSVKFSVSDLAEFTAMVHSDSANGFAVYFATYPKDGSIDPRVYQGRDTIIFIPTRDGVPVFDPYATYLLPEDSKGFNHGELNP